MSDSRLALARGDITKLAIAPQSLVSARTSS